LLNRRTVGATPSLDNVPGSVAISLRQSSFSNLGLEIITFSPISPTEEILVILIKQADIEDGSYTARQTEL